MQIKNRNTLIQVHISHKRMKWRKENTFFISKEVEFSFKRNMKHWQRGRGWCSALTDSISSQRTISVRYGPSSYPVLSHFFTKKKKRKKEGKRESVKARRLCERLWNLSVRIGAHGGEDVSWVFLFLSEITHCSSGKRLSEVTLFLIKLSNDAGTQEISRKQWRTYTS